MEQDQERPRFTQRSRRNGWRNASKSSAVPESSFSHLSSRKGFELAISTIVVMILGAIIVAGGIILVSRIAKDSEKIVGSVTNEQHDALKRLLSDGQLVATYPASQKIVGGKTGTFAVAVVNRLDGKRTFHLEFPDKPAGLTITTIPDLELEENAQKEFAVAVKTDKNMPAGRYTVLVKVTEGGNTYDSARFVEVNVQ